MNLTHLIKDSHPVARGGLWFARHSPGAPGYNPATHDTTTSGQHSEVQGEHDLRKPLDRFALAGAWTITIGSFALAAIVGSQLIHQFA